MMGLVKRASIAGVLLVGLLVLAPSSASAQGGGFYLGFGLGPAFRLDDWPTQLRVEFDVGYYVEGRPEGFFLAFSPSASFFADFAIGVFPLRLGYMFTVYRGSDITFTLGPTGTIGFALDGCTDRDCGTSAFFHFSVAFALRLLFANDTIAAYIRPVDFEFAFTDNPNNDRIRYILTGGLQFHI
jgi:hypothetical protein